MTTFLDVLPEDFKQSWTKKHYYNRRDTRAG
jgi:hypothetical protein